VVSFLKVNADGSTARAVGSSVLRVFQGSVGEADREQASPVGSPHHLHRADQESCLQVLEPRLCALCSRDREVGFPVYIFSSSMFAS